MTNNNIIKFWNIRRCICDVNSSSLTTCRWFHNPVHFFTFSFKSFTFLYEILILVRNYKWLWRNIQIFLILQDFTHFIFSGNFKWIWKMVNFLIFIQVIKELTLILIQPNHIPIMSVSLLESIFNECLLNQFPITVELFK